MLDWSLTNLFRSFQLTPARKPAGAMPDWSLTNLLPFRAYCVGDLQKFDDVSRPSVRRLSVRHAHHRMSIIGYQNRKIS